MNSIVLLADSLFIPGKAKRMRILAGSAFGALAACLLLVLHALPMALTLFLRYFVINSLMLILSFRLSHLAQYIKLMLVHYFMSFFMGGLLTSITNGLPANKLLIPAMAIVILAFLWPGILYIRQDKSLAGMVYDVCISYRGSNVTVRGIYDTGNCLCDPYSGDSVTLCEMEVLKDFFTDRELHTLHSLPSLTDESEPLPLRLIPYQAVGTEKGLLAAIRMEQVQIFYNNHPFCIESPLIALYPGKLSSDSQVTCIIHKDWK